ncbi:Uncharacterised protein [Enterobacter hormaechei]|nr:Uncharacterised protein [Enterobacter hormaechei]
MQVTIDGVPFVPACATASRIGLAITTHNRPDVLKRAIEQHTKHLPIGALVVVIDDGSIPAVVVPDGVQLLRHETSLGIVASKNASLTALIMQWVMPIAAQWSIRATRWWTMQMLNRLNVTLTQRHAQNAAGRGG